MYISKSCSQITIHSKLICDIIFDVCTAVALGVCWILCAGLPLIERCTYVRSFPVTYVIGTNATL